MKTLQTLTILIALSTAQDCTTKNAIKVCVDHANPGFSYRVLSPGLADNDFQDKSILVVGDKPLGPSIGVSASDCKFPNRLGRNYKSAQGAPFSSSFSWLYLGFLHVEDLGKHPICHAYCSESYCPAIDAPSCRTLLATFEGPLSGKSVQSFFTNLLLINPLTEVSCYLKDFDAEGLNFLKVRDSIPPYCTKIFLELSISWEKGKECPFSSSFPDVLNISSKYSPVYLTIPAFGYDLVKEENGFRNSVCKGPFKKMTNVSVSGDCLHEVNSNCVFASPAVVWDLAKNLYKKGNIQGFYLLPSMLMKSSSSVKNQVIEPLTSLDVHEFISGLGRGYSLSDEPSNCRDIETDSITECVWVESIDLEDAGFCVGESVTSGYVGAVICDLSCKNEFTATVCDIMTCHGLESISLSNKYIYWKLETKVAIETGGQYAWADVGRKRHCFGNGQFVICEGGEIPSCLCNSARCWGADFKLGSWNRLGRYCQTLSCFLSHTQMSTRNLLVLESSSQCKSQLTQQGTQMKLVSVSDEPISSTCLQSKSQRICRECGELVCHLTLELDFADPGDEVLSDCDSVITPLLWMTRYNLGEKVGVPQIDYLLTSWVSADRYWKWIFAFALLAFFQMTAWTIKILGFHHIIKKFFICLFRIVFLTPSFFKEVWRNFFWFRRRYHFCPGCGGDINFLDHKEDTCLQTEHYCKFPISGGICGETISESQTFFRHWVVLHLPSKAMKLAFWINPLNIWKFYQVKLADVKLPTKRQEIEELKSVVRGPSKRVSKSKRLPMPLLGVALISLIQPADLVINIAPSLNCVKGFCKMTTSGVMDNLYSGSTSCFKSTSDGVNFEFCLSVKTVLITGTAQVIKCRVTPEVKFFGTFRCSNAWAISWYNDELEAFKECTQFAYRNEARVGGYDWGCSLPNANSIFLKGYLTDSRLPTPCIIDTTGGWSVKTILCISTGDETQCDNSGEGKINIQSFNLTYVIDFPGKVSLPDRLVVMPDGSFRKVLDDSNGCFLFHKKKIGGSECSYPIHFPSYACGYSINPSGIRGHCSVPDESLCEDPLSYPLFNTGDCFLAKAVPSIDSNSFLITGRGCSNGMSSLRFEVSGTIEIAPVTGSVISLEVHDCVGYSGISLGASCVVFPNCDGKKSICSLTSPVILDIPCFYNTRVYFSSSDKKNTSFSCGEAVKVVEMNLTIVMPQKDTLNRISNSIIPLEGSNSLGAGYSILIVMAIAFSLIVAVWVGFAIAKKVKELKATNYQEKIL